MLALPPCDYDLTEPLVSSTITLQQIDVEPVGEAYEAYVARRYLQAEEVEEGEDLQKEEGEEEINKEKMSEKRKKHRNRGGISFKPTRITTKLKPQIDATSAARSESRWFTLPGWTDCP